MLRYSFILLFLSALFQALGQQPLSLETALKQAQLRNKQLYVSSLEINLADADLQKLKSAYLPQIHLIHQYMATNDPLNAFGYKLQQSGIQSADFNPELLNDPEIGYQGQTKLSLQQSLFHYDQMALKKAMKARLQAAQYQNNRAEDKIQLEVKNAYTDLQYLYAAQEVSQKALLAMAENEKVVQNFMLQGMAKKSDLLNIQLESSNIKIQLSKLRHSIENLSAYIAFLIGDALTTKYQPSSPLQMDSLGAYEMNLLDRADFKAMQSAIESKTYNRKYGKQGLIPKLNAFGEFNVYSKNVFGFDHHAFLAGIQLQWNVFNGNARSYEAQKQKIEIEKTRKEMEQLMDQSSLEIIKAQNDRILSLDDVEQAQKNAVLAEEYKRIITDRFKQGLEKTSDVLNAELALMDKNLKVMEHISKHNKAIQYLEFLNAPSKN